MRKTLCLLLILISKLTFGQTEFCIRINSDVDIDIVTVHSLNLSKKFSSEFENGIAIVKIPITSSDQYSIFIADKKIGGWFNSGKIDVYLDYKENELSVSKTLNTPVYDRQVKYFKDYKVFLDDKSIGTEFIKNTIIENDQDAFVLLPLNQYLKLFQNDKKELKFVEEFLEKQPKATKEHMVYGMIKSRLEKLKEIKKIELNKYSLIDLNGKTSKIKIEPNKKYTILDFWFTNCPPCIKEHKEILANPNIFNNLNAELIGISTDETQEKWLNYLEKKKVNWKNYRIEKSSLDKDLGIWSFPTYIILDQENNVLGSYSNIADTIEALKK
ncbi:MAG: TlpA disulfide reductase family protein [Polaribacter sp.]|nr:TlpA disulfide reductase family protein [Polaribacter sp.]